MGSLDIQGKGNHFTHILKFKLHNYKFLKLKLQDEQMHNKNENI